MTGNTAEIGGGVVDFGGLTLTDVVIEGNHARIGGGLRSGGHVEGDRITIAKNIADSSGGGAYFNGGTVAIRDSVITSNQAVDGAGITNFGSFQLTRSTLSLNVGSGEGGGLYNISTADLSDSLIDRNSAVRGGGVYSQGPLSLNAVDVLGNGSSEAGAGAYLGGVSTILQSTFMGNEAVGWGGGIYLSSNSSLLDAQDSVFSNNSAEAGGAITAFAPIAIRLTEFNGNSATADGGALNIYKLADISDVELTHNSAPNGGAIFNYGSLTLQNSTVAMNTASNRGGAFFNGNVLDLINVTVSGNSAALAAAYFGQSTDVATVSSSTIVNNVADRWGSFYVRDGSVSFENTIIANNSGLVTLSDQHGVYTTLGHNLFDVLDLPITPVATDLAGSAATPLDPMLGRLSENGGPTLTHPLLPGGPAIDSGFATSPPATDQRGLSRVADGDSDGTSIVDRGAFEAQPQKGPTASLNGNGSLRVNPGQPEFRFSVMYQAEEAIDISSADSFDIRVTGPNDFSQFAEFIGWNVDIDSTSGSATYRVEASDAAFDAGDEGTYVVHLNAEQIFDISGNAAIAGPLGSFTAEFGPGQIPTVGSVTTSTSSLFAGSSFTLTAHGVDFGDSESLRVVFGRDENGTGRWEHHQDKRWGASDHDGSDGWSVEVDTTGFAPGTYTFFAAAQAATAVVGPSTATTITILNAATAAATGVVFDDSNANGIHDLGESGIQDVIVFDDANGNGLVDVGENLTWTDAQGAYSFPSIEVGSTHTLSVATDDAWRQTFPRHGELLFDVNFNNYNLGPYPIGVGSESAPKRYLNSAGVDNSAGLEVVSSAGDLTSQSILLSGVGTDGWGRAFVGVGGSAVQGPLEWDSGRVDLYWRSLVTMEPPSAGNVGSEVRTQISVTEIMNDERPSGLTIYYRPGGQFEIEDANGSRTVGSFTPGEADGFHLVLDLDAETYALNQNGMPLTTGRLGAEGDFSSLSFGSYIFGPGMAAPLAIDDIQVIISPTNAPPKAHQVSVHAGESVTGLNFGILVTEPVDSVPVAVADAFSVWEDQPLTLDLLANDSSPTGGTLVPEIVQWPINGTLDWSPSVEKFIYTGFADFYGVDQFTYRVHDGVSYSDVSRVTITVDAVNEAPIISGPSTPIFLSSRGGAQSFTVDINAGPSNESQQLALTATTDRFDLVDIAGVAYTGGDGRAVVTLVPRGDVQGTVNITVSATDSGLDGLLGNGDDLSDVATFSVELTAAIHLPAEAGTGDGRNMMRSNAAGELTRWLHAGEAIALPFTLDTPGIYDFMIRTANDNYGPLETIELVLDGVSHGTITPPDTGDWGYGWNVFTTLDFAGSVLLSAGDHVAELIVSGGDGVGVEVDTLMIGQSAELPALHVTGDVAFEGFAGANPVTLELALERALPFAMDFELSTLPGTAGPDDFVSVDRQLVTIPAGSTRQAVELLVLGDTREEGDETFTVSIHNRATGDIIDHLITILEDGSATTEPLAVSIEPHLGDPLFILLHVFGIGLGGTFGAGYPAALIDTPPPAPPSQQPPTPPSGGAGNFQVDLLEDRVEVRVPRSQFDSSKPLHLETIDGSTLIVPSDLEERADARRHRDSGFALVGYQQSLQPEIGDETIFVTYGGEVILNDGDGKIVFAQDGASVIVNAGSPLIYREPGANVSGAGTPVVNDVNSLGVSLVEPYHIEADLYSDGGPTDTATDEATPEDSSPPEPAFALLLDPVTSADDAVADAVDVVPQTDVNGDNFTTPLDALLIVNAINGMDVSTTTFAALDVSQDGVLSPLDVLIVVNRLNQAADGEGEGGEYAGGLPLLVHRDSMTSDLPAAPAITAVGQSNHYPGHVSQPAGGTLPTRRRITDELDDLLDTLAEDLSKLKDSQL